MGVKPDEYLTYEQLMAALPARGRVFLLLGNGFSIACDRVFRYASLYDAAVQAGLSPRAQAVFGRLGTNNFEGVLRLLEDAEWIARQYGIDEPALRGLRSDAEIVRRTLIKAVSRAHLDHPGEIPETRKLAARQFVSRYHHVFTTNYDLRKNAPSSTCYGPLMSYLVLFPALCSVRVFLRHLGVNLLQVAQRI